MKKLLLLFFSLFLLPLSAFAIVPKGEDYYVTDEAHLLSKKTINYIKNNSFNLHNLELIDFYVVTISDLGDFTMEEYTDQIFKEYNIGEEGILIFVSRGKSLLRVQLGGDLSEFIDEDIISQYINIYFAPYIEHGDWDTGIKNGYNAFYKLICNHYHLDSSSIEVYDKVDFKTKYGDYIIVGFAIFLMILAKILLDMFKNIFKRKKYHDNVIDYFFFAFLLVVNIVIICVCGFLKPVSLIVLILVEAISLYSFYQNDKAVYYNRHGELIHVGKSNTFNNNDISSQEEQELIQKRLLRKEKLLLKLQNAKRGFNKNNRKR